MNKQLIESLRHRAHVLLDAIEYRQRDHDARGVQHDFKKWRDAGGSLWYELESHDCVVFYLQGVGNRSQFIKFSGIKPVNATDVKIHPPIIKDRKVIDASTHTVVNNSNATVKRTYEVEKTRETNRSHEVGVQVTIGLRAMMRFGTENSPVGGEVELTAEVQSHYNQTRSVTESSAISTGTEVEIPAKSSVTFTTSRSVAKYEQTLEYTANIDHKTEVVLARDQGGWGNRIHYVEFENWTDALRIMQGGGYKNDDYQDYVERFRRKPIAQWEVDKLTAAKGVPITVKVEFDEATVTDVAVE